MRARRRPARTWAAAVVYAGVRRGRAWAVCTRLRLSPVLLTRAMPVRPRLVRTWVAGAVCAGVRQVRGGLMTCGLMTWELRARRRAV